LLVNDTRGTAIFDPPEEATAVAFVANSWPQRLDTQKQCIGVAIYANLLHPQNVTAGFALSPQAVAGSAEKDRLAGSSRFCKRFIVHEAEHQDLAGAAVLDDGGNEAAAFLKCDLHVLPPKSCSQKQKTR
jgi:hypothetical protein